MNKLSKIIIDMDEAELRQVKQDIEEGNIQRLVNQTLAARQEDNPNKVCPVCHAPITDTAETLVFGPAGLRKKASFCAFDCLEFFITRLKEQKNMQPQLQSSEGNQD